MATPLTKLPSERRLEIVEYLWVSIAAEEEKIALSAEQKRELEQRLDEFELDGDLGRPADEVLAEIRLKL